MTIDELKADIAKLKATRDVVLNKGVEIRVNRSDGITRPDLETLNVEINKLELRLAFLSRKKGKIF